MPPANQPVRNDCPQYFQVIQQLTPNGDFGSEVSV